MIHMSGTVGRLTSAIRGENVRVGKRENVTQSEKNIDGMRAVGCFLLEILIVSPDDAVMKNLRNVRHKAYIYTGPSRRNKTRISTDRP
jgi:hypothetical protein